MVSSTDEAFVEQGKPGPFGGCGILSGGDGVDFAGAADEVADGERKFIPTDTAFIAIVIDTGDEGWRGNDVKDGGSEIGGIGR